MVDDREPSLDEMLADPVVLAMMSRDGVSRTELNTLISEIRLARRMLRQAAASPSDGIVCPC